jgi:hypothetical protein
MPSLDQLFQSLPVGAENELLGTCLKLWDTAQSCFVETSCGSNIAAAERGDSVSQKGVSSPIRLIKLPRPRQLSRSVFKHKRYINERVQKIIDIQKPLTNREPKK